MASKWQTTFKQNLPNTDHFGVWTLKFGPLLIYLTLLPTPYLLTLLLSMHISSLNVVSSNLINGWPLCQGQLDLPTCHNLTLPFCFIRNNSRSSIYNTTSLPFPSITKMLGHSTLYEPRLGWVHEWTKIRFEWEGSWEYESNKKKKKTSKN